MGADRAGQIRAALEAAGGDEQRAAAQRRYMRSTLPFRGLGVPAVRAVVRQVTREYPPATYEEWRGAVLSLWDDATFREDRYAALGLARSHPVHARARESLPLHRHLVVTGAWWDLVDETAAHLVGAVLAAHPEHTSDVLREWAREGDLWLRRAAILAQLRRKDATDRQLLLDVVEPNVAAPEFFVRKAIGWALRQYAHVDDDAAAWVRSTVSAYGDRLSPLSPREALRS